jgi:hypothetical protein
MGGSSGGMVCLAKDGSWIGMITLGLSGGGNFHWMVPIRNVRKWAKEAKVEWLLDPKAKAPTEEQVKAITLENGPAFSSSKASSPPAQFKAMIRVEPLRMFDIRKTAPIEVR